MALRSRPSWFSEPQLTEVGGCATVYLYSIRKGEMVVQFCELTIHICVQEAIVAHEDAERFERLLREAIRSLERERHASLSQADVAAAMGVGRRALQEWLGRRRTPSSSVALLNLL